jgi:nitrilase
VWLATLRHIAREGAVFVVGCSIAQRRDAIPDRHRLLRERYAGDSPEWINQGNSCVVEPSGEFLARPLTEREEILHVKLDLDAIPRERWRLDVAGHGRPDVFQLTVHRQRWPMVNVVDGPPGPEKPAASHRIAAPPAH